MKSMQKLIFQVLALAALALLVLALASCAPATLAPGPAQPAAAELSAAELEQQYGTRVNVLAVTAVGGLVDVRLKIFDATKANRLFQGQTPSLLVEAGKAVLSAPEESQAQVRHLQDDGAVFLMYPNTNTVVKPGDKVTLLFGDKRLQPIAAQ